MGRQRVKNLHRDLSKERDRGREEESKNRDLSNRSLKTDGRQKVKHLHMGLSKERERGEERRARTEI